MDLIPELWQRIDTWLQTFAPARAARLSPGATSEELAEIEVVLGLTLPEDFKASYRIHNGAWRGSYLLMGSPEFYPLSQILSLGKMFHMLLQKPGWPRREPYFLSDPERQSLPVQPVWYHPHWVAFAGDGGGFQWCIDLAPTSGGTRGQVIAYDHEEGPADLLFPSFEALLSIYADQLEAGFYLGHSPILRLKKVTYLQERRAAFLEASPAKPLLHRAIKYAWAGGNMENLDKSMAAFQQVLQLEAATPEDRFFALYGLVTWCSIEGNYQGLGPGHFARLESEAQRMEASHWVHEEIALLKPWSVRSLKS